MFLEEVQRYYYTLSRETEIPPDYLQFFEEKIQAMFPEASREGKDAGSKLLKEIDKASSKGEEALKKKLIEACRTLCEWKTKQMIESLTQPPHPDFQEVIDTLNPGQIAALKKLTAELLSIKPGKRPKMSDVALDLDAALH